MAITYIEALLEYLKDAPREWAQVIAARAAIRVLPYAFGQRVQSQWVSDYSISLFRATSISWAAVNCSIYDMRPASQAANFAAWGAGQSAVAVISNDSAGYEYMQVAAQVAYAAAHASGTGSVGNYVNQASLAVNDAHACSALFDTTAETDPIGWANINADCVWLAEHPASKDAALAMAGMKLWPAGKPEGWSEAWASASELLATLDLGYGEWIDWYNRRIEGHDAAFDIPGDHDRTEDKKILARLADATNKDFWDKGATYVNTTLQRWIDEACERLAAPDEPPLELDQDTIAAIAAPLASPDVIAINNKLDVVPNAILDAQSDAFDLAEAIAVLRALVGTLRPCLTDNISPIFAPSLARYDLELDERAAKPFIGVLARMEEQIETQFNAEPDAFEAGVGINFKSYFAEHRKFMTHYHHHLEREKVIAELNIDDRAASGKALTSAFDAAVRSAEELFNQGLATDGYRDEIVAQQQNLKALEYSQDTAGNKRAKLLQIVQSVGFLQQTLIASATIVATVAALPQFVTAVEAAIAALSKFFI